MTIEEIIKALETNANVDWNENNPATEFKTLARELRLVRNSNNHGKGLVND